MVMLPSQAAPDWRRSFDRLAFSGTTQWSCSAFLRSPSAGAAILPSRDLLGIARPYTTSPSLHQRQRMRFEVHSLRAGAFSRLKSSHEAEAGNLLVRAAAHAPAHHGLRAQGDRWPRWPSMVPLLCRRDVTTPQGMHVHCSPRGIPPGSEELRVQQNTHFKEKKKKSSHAPCFSLGSQLNISPACSDTWQPTHRTCRARLALQPLAPAPSIWASSTAGALGHVWVRFSPPSSSPRQPCLPRACLFTRCCCCSN